MSGGTTRFDVVPAGASVASASRDPVITELSVITRSLLARRLRGDDSLGFRQNKLNLPEEIQIDIAPADAEVERGRRNQGTQAALCLGRLDFAALPGVQGAVMQGDGSRRRPECLSKRRCAPKTFCCRPPPACAASLAD